MFAHSLSQSSLDLTPIWLLSPSLPWNNLSVSHWPSDWLIPWSVFIAYLTRLSSSIQQACSLPLPWRVSLSFLGHHFFSSHPVSWMLPAHLISWFLLLYHTSKCWSSPGPSPWTSSLYSFHFWSHLVLQFKLHLYAELSQVYVSSLLDIFIATHPTSYSASPPGSVIGIQNDKWLKPNFIFFPPTLPNSFTLNQSKPNLISNSINDDAVFTDVTKPLEFSLTFLSLTFPITAISTSCWLQNVSRTHPLPNTSAVYPSPSHSYLFAGSLRQRPLWPPFSSVGPPYSISTQQQSESFIMRIRPVPALLSILQWLPEPSMICSSTPSLIWPPNGTPYV